MNTKNTKGPSIVKLSVLKDDGSRNHVYPADVRGFFAKYKYKFFYFLAFVYAIVPWIKINGAPAILIDIPKREFFFFGFTFNAQDFYLAFFVLSGIGFTLFMLSALFGRVWCGWACPQTVFLEGFYRRIERLIEGPRAQRLRLNDAPWNAEKIRKRALKFGIYFIFSFMIANIFISYFVSLPNLFEMMKQSPLDHFTPFVWMFVMTGILFFNFAWFREQTCLIVCPYGRLQSALQDDDTLIVGYDEKRGEPRGKKKDPAAADCIDCGRCVTVCPTGIDIRNGLQMECIGCTSCIDACDEMMVKVGRDKGLIRYDSLNGLIGRKKRFLRPRLFVYLLAGLVGASVASFAFLSRQSFEANILRLQGVPYSFDGDLLRNQVMIHIVNKEKNVEIFDITPCKGQNKALNITIPQKHIELKGFGSRQIPILVNLQKSDFKKTMELCLTVKTDIIKDGKDVSIQVMGP